jgi:hypothetical protein
MLSLNSFSQTDTTRVSLRNNIAREVVKDLIRYDGCTQELILTQEKVGKLEERDSQKDVIITLLNDKDKNNQFIIGTQKDQLELSKELSGKLQKEIKSYRLSNFGWKAGTMLGIATSLVLLIK